MKKRKWFKNEAKKEKKKQNKKCPPRLNHFSNNLIYVDEVYIYSNLIITKWI